MFMHAKHDNLVDADTAGAKASTKHLESRLEVIQCHAFWDHSKADEGHVRVRNFEGKVWASKISRTPLSFGAPYLGNPANIGTNLRLHFKRLESLTYIFPLTVWVYSIFFWWAP